LTDHLEPAARSDLMSRVRSFDTKPELALRHALFAKGFRYRLHRKDLPGKPDIVFPSRRKVIFVHGCFWHQHPGCKYATIPKSNTDFWVEKFRRNTKRDSTNIADLAKLDWKALVIWQCQIKELDNAVDMATQFLSEVNERQK
jgi:DNA mismatch endonuclease (patch repair protein)